jgi:hypothetical protein
MPSLRSLPLIACAALLLHAAPARAEGERSVGWAYGIASAGVLVPGWAATAVLPRDDDPDTGFSPRVVAALTGYYASIAWGPAAGYYYSGNARYATLSGLGKTGLLGAGVAANRLFERDGHPYLLAMSVIGATMWGVGDFLFLRRDVRRQNRSRTEGSVTVPISLALPGPAFLIGLGGTF